MAANKEKKELKTIFKKYGVTAAYLFGSTTKGSTHKGSDTDIAVRFSKSLNLKKTLSLIDDLTPFFNNPIDLVDLEKAPLQLQFRIFKERHLLYVLDAKKEALKKAKSLSMYHDYKFYFDRFNAFELKRIATHGLI